MKKYIFLLSLFFIHQQSYGIEKSDKIFQNLVSAWLKFFHLPDQDEQVLHLNLASNTVASQDKLPSKKIKELAKLINTNNYEQFNKLLTPENAQEKLEGKSLDLMHN